MTKFIAIPKEDTALSLLNIPEICVSKTSRKKQLKALKKARQEALRLSVRSDPNETLKSLAAGKLATPVKQSAVTGAVIMDGEMNNLDAIRASMPDYQVIVDLPMTLVRPVKAGPKVAANAIANIDTWHLEAIQLMRARNSGFTGTGKGVGVAILDTGIEEVAEIKGKVKTAFELDSASGKVVEIDTVDTDGHGTHCAGLVAGTNVGVAPDAELMNYIMIPNGTGSIFDFIEAIDFIAGRPEISIMSMSAGIPGYHGGMEVAIRALRAAGVLPVVAIGNEGRNTSRSPGNYVEVVSVGASTKQDRVANFSSSTTISQNNQSYTVPDLVSPGQGVTSCVMGGGYESWDGTSMATPIVAGVAALIVERYPDISLIDLEGELLDALRELPNVAPIRQGEGLQQTPPHLWHTGF